MSEFKGSSEDPAQLINHEVFNKYFPWGKIEILPYDAFPADFKSIVDIPNNRRAITFAINHDDGSKTYGVDDSLLERLYLHDEGSSGEYIGRGELDHRIIEDEITPIVGDTLTANHKHEGFGARRIKIMNALSQMLYKKPLTSGIITHKYENQVWERLVLEGKAEKLPPLPGKPQTYRFLS